MRFLLILFIPMFSYAHSVKEEPLVCIHGILAGPWSMRYIEKHFEKEGYPVINWGYPSLYTRCFKNWFFAALASHIFHPLASTLFLIGPASALVQAPVENFGRQLCQIPNF